MSTVIINRVKVEFIDILDLIISEMAVLMKSKPKYWEIADNDSKDDLTRYVVKSTVRNKEDFTRIKFELIKWIKKMPLPCDRIMPYEYHDHDTQLIDFDQKDRLIESRKTRKEKDEDMKIKELLQRRA